MSDDVNGEAAGLILAEAVRLITRQEVQVDTIRNQTVALISVASIVAGLFGSRVLPGHHSVRTNEFSIWALAVFGTSALVALLILLPRRWKFAPKLEVWITRLANKTPTPAASFAYNRAADLEERRRGHGSRMTRFGFYYAFLCALVGAQVILWAVAAL